jgi:hypothetical protein
MRSSRYVQGSFYLDKECSALLVDFEHAESSTIPRLPRSPRISRSQCMRRNSAWDLSRHGVNEDRCVIDAALTLSVRTMPSPVNWPLRLAQQAFARVLDYRGHSGGSPAAVHRHGARYALSVLSKTDRESLKQWLVLQLSTATQEDARKSFAKLGGIDVSLVTAIRDQFARVDPGFVWSTKTRHSIQHAHAHFSGSESATEAATSGFLFAVPSYQSAASLGKVRRDPF